MPQSLPEAAQRLAKSIDTAYKKYKETSQEEISTLPSEREDFSPCSAKYVRKALKYFPEDKISQEKYLADMLNVCRISHSPIKADKEPKERKKSTSGWVCYLKTCAKEEPEMTYMQCMKDTQRKEEKYNPFKDEWKQKALEGCQSGL